VATVKLKPIAEQVVVVCGASSGIGREAARRFAQRGARVVVAARGEEGLASLVEEIRGAGGEAMAFTCDVADFAQVKHVADGAVVAYGRIDTWAHAAGVISVGPFERLKPEDVKRIVDVNLVGQMYGAMAALPHLKNSGGALIHVSSIEAKRAFPWQAVYGASKHGIDGFLEALRLELAREDAPVSVTQVMPAAINTPLYDKGKSVLGVKPLAPPPVYQPGVVADVILYAAEHPARDLIAGGSGASILFSQRLSPRLVDAMLRLVAFRAQQTDEPEPADAPNNLFAPIAGHDTVEGRFGKQATSRSLYNWLEMHPAATRGIASGAALGIAGLLATRASKGAR